VKFKNSCSTQKKLEVLSHPITIARFRLSPMSTFLRPGARAEIAALLFFTPLLVAGADLPQARHSFTVVAHRGDRTRAHENTLTAIEHAIAAGVDYVELDVRRTADGSYVLMHDRTVDRMTDGHGAVAQMTLAQLQSLHVRDLNRTKVPADHVPTFSEALAAIKGRMNL
jgi:glycerophosphoryl diester phosphodiesterase